MTVGDYTVRFDVDEFGIRVTADEVDEYLEEHTIGNMGDEEKQKRAARNIALSQFWKMTSEQTGDIKTKVWKTTYEGTRF